jgi:hypothetical protein
MEDFAESSGLHNASGIPAYRRGYAAQIGESPDDMLRLGYQDMDCLRKSGARSRRGAPKKRGRGRNRSERRFIKKLLFGRLIRLSQ